jgi:DNA-binding beta-propeller fold protein YncE
MHRFLTIAALAATSATAQVPGLTGTLVVTNKSPSTATIIDVASGRIMGTLPTGSGPHEVVLSSDGRWAVVTDYGGPPRKTLTVIDLATMRVARTIDLGQYTSPHGIAFLPGDSVVAVTSESTGNVALVHIVSGVRRAVATQGQGSHMLGVTADGARAYTGNMRSNTVSELDLRTGQFVRSWTVPETPEAINVTPDGKEVWVGSNATGRVSVIDVATGAITTAAEGLGWPYRVLYSPDAKTVMLPDLRGDELRFVDRATKREISRIPFNGGGPQGITTTPDGRYIFQSLSRHGRVAIIDAKTRAVVGHLAAGDTPDGVAYTTRAYAIPLPPSTSRPADVESIDAIIAALYDVISGPKGQKRDWNRFLGLFAPGARLMATGRRADGTRVVRMMTPEEYAANSGGLEANGFFEREIGRETEMYGAIAQVFSAYDSKRTLQDAQPFARGINSIQLVNDGKRWWVFSILWDPERPDQQIPERYLRKSP